MLHEHLQQHRSGHSGGACTESSLAVYRPTATFIVKSSIFNPREEQGGAFSHVPDSRENAASRRARECMSRGRRPTDYPRMLLSMNPTPFGGIGVSGSALRWGCHDHRARVSSWCGVEVEQLRCRGRMWVINSEQAATKAKKVEGARCTALLIPSPPLLT